MDPREMRDELARLLSTMPYGILTQIAKEIVEMNGEESGVNRHPETIHGMAETLYDWGEANSDPQ